MKKFCIEVWELIIIISGLFLLSLVTINNVKADTTITAKFVSTKTEGNFYQTTIDFQLSNEGTQLIFYSPDYDNLLLSTLRSELGSNNVIADSEKKQVIINLKDKLDKNNSGSLTVQMKKADSDILYIRDIDGNELANENLVTSKPVSENTKPTTFSALSASNLLSDTTSSTNNALTVNNALSSSTVSDTPTAVLTNPVISVDSQTITDYSKDLTVHGTWESSQSSITIYYRFKFSGIGMTTGEGRIPGIEMWGVLGTFTGTPGVVHEFTATIPASTIRAIGSGKIILYTNYLDPVKDNLGTNYQTPIIFSPYADNLKIYVGDQEVDTSYDKPYIARGNSITLTAKMSTNVAGTLRFVVDGDTSNAPSVNLTIPGTSSSVSQKINLSNLGSDDGKVHEASYEFVVSGNVLYSVKFYFVVGNVLKLTVPQTIDFGSHLYTDFLKGFTATPNITGQLTLFDGRIGTYSGNLGLSASATTFKNSAGDVLNTNLYWNNVLIPSNGTGVKIGELQPPTTTNASFKNFTEDMKSDLKLVTPKDSSPMSGDYSSTMTWTVNDTMQ